MKGPLFDYLRLTRPANLVTAVSDVVAGAALAGFFASGTWEAGSYAPLLLVMLSTIGLYGGGVVLNDVFDAELDRVERPERPIPSGRVSKERAALLGVLLLLLGIGAALFVPSEDHLPLFLSIAIAVAAVVYDKWGKHHSFLGPVNMGLCRGLNLLLGMSIVAGRVPELGYLGLVPVLYIAAITMVSRGEVHGGSRGVLYTAALFYALVLGAVLLVAFRQDRLPIALPFVVLFGWAIFRPLFEAIAQPSGPLIGKAVKAGVLSLIILNASWAAASGALAVALVLLFLLPLSIGLARLFAVT